MNVPRPFMGKISSTHYACVENGLLSSVVSGLCCPEEIQGQVELPRPEWGRRSLPEHDDMTLWPPVIYRNVFCYFIDRPGVYTKQKLSSGGPWRHTITIKVDMCALWRYGPPKVMFVF